MKWAVLGIAVIAMAVFVFGGSPSPQASQADGRWPASGPGCSASGGRLLPAPRDLFSDDAKNADKAELCRLYGVPDSTSTSGDTEFWYYRGATRDPLTGKVDSSTQVVIRNGKVDQVNF